MTKMPATLVAAVLAVATGVAHADGPTTPQVPPSSPPGPNENLNNGSGSTERPWAKGVSQSEQDLALGLFREGNQFLNEGLLEKAADKYKLAIGHWDHPAINYNYALALRNLNKPVEVDTALKKAIEYGPEPIGADKYELAKQYLAINAQLLAEIEVTCEKPGADVSIDGKHVFFGPGKYSEIVRTGKHTIVAQKPGAISRIRAPFIGGQEHFRVELKLYTPEELTRYKRKWQATWLPYAVIGLGAVVGGVGGLFELSARNEYRSYDEEVAKCNNAGTSPVPFGTGCPTSDTFVVHLRESADTKQSIAYVGYGVGAAVAVTGGILAFVNRRTPYQIRAEDMEDDREPTGVSFAPIVTPTMTGAALQGHF